MLFTLNLTFALGTFILSICHLPFMEICIVNLAILHLFIQSSNKNQSSIISIFYESHFYRALVWFYQ
jgi:hypothetical protein